MAPDMMHKAYAQFLRPQSQGHALYFPVQAENISPGCLGYFDDNGDWHLLEQCVDSTTLPVEPFRGDLRTVSSSPYDAPLICSQNLQSRTSQLKLSLDVSCTSVPAVLEAAVQTSDLSKGAAILQCDPITRQSLKNGSELKGWGKNNAKNILKTHGATREYGFFLVTSTRRTKKCQLKCWSSTVRSIDSKLLCSSPVYSGGASEISGEYKKAGAQAGWIRCPSNEDQNAWSREYVVFVDGYFFRTKLLGKVLTVTRERIYRGSEDVESGTDNAYTTPDLGFTVFLDENQERYEITCEEWIA